MNWYIYYTIDVFVVNSTTGKRMKVNQCFSELTHFNVLFCWLLSKISAVYFCYATFGSESPSPIEKTFVVSPATQHKEGYPQTQQTEC